MMMIINLGTCSRSGSRSRPKTQSMSGSRCWFRTRSLFRSKIR